MFRKNKKSQEAGGGSAAVLVAIIAFMIILYILFLPPEERTQLLDGDKADVNSGTGDSGTVPPGTGSTGGTDEPEIDENILLLDNPGMLSIQGDNKVNHIIPKIRLYDKPGSKILEDYSGFNVKRSLFDNKPKMWEIEIEDYDNTENVLLNFDVKKSKGDIIIKFNGKEVYEGYLSKGNIEPIPIKDNLLQKNNNIKFSVSSPGIKFWSTNQYYLEDIKLIGTEIDISHLESKNKFYISEDEIKTAKKLELKYYPICTPSKIGILTIKINDQEVYSGTPTCNIQNKFEFGPELVHLGNNDIEFSTTEGDYEINRVDLRSEVEEREYYTYYFNLAGKYFTEDDEPECGEIDNECPAGCDEDDDKDCCFDESSDNFWCDLETDDTDDRCVSAMDQEKCSRCLTGYEDKKGKASEVCEGMCGDDKDDLCPTDCNMNYDKDCCYEDNEDNYWCNDVPITGVDSVCEASITSGECDDCVSTYKDKGGKRPSGCAEIEVTEKMLKKGYKVMLDFELLDDEEEKKFEISINGHKDMIITEEDKASKDISSSVRENYNYLKITPDKSFEISEIKISLEE